METRTDQRPALRPGRPADCALEAGEAPGRGGLGEARPVFPRMRHSLGAALYVLGLDREARKAALGHTSDAARAVYERDGNQLATSYEPGKISKPANG